MTAIEEAKIYVKAFECLKGRYQNKSGVFVIGCLDKGRNTVLSQQHRAISLINALDCLGRLKHAKIPGQRPKIAVVGGGVAGVTAAICAVRKGIEVHLFEKATDVLTLFHGASHRSIHPNLFNWPKEGSLNPTARLPFLQWEFATATEVARNLRDQFRRFELDNTDLLQVHRGTTRRLSDDTGHRPTLVTLGDGNPLDFDHVVVAVGFGEETRENWHADSYWQADSFTSVRFNTVREFIVVGTGDGGLIDCLRLRLGKQDMTFEKQIDSFLKEWEQEDHVEYESARRAIAGIEGTNPEQHESTELRRKYSELKVPTAVKLIQEKDWLRRDTRVILVGRAIDPRNGMPATLFGGWQAPINRFLISLLQRIDSNGFDYVNGDFIFPAKAPLQWTITTKEKTVRYSSETHQDSRCLVLRVGPSSIGVGDAPAARSPLTRFSAQVARDAEANLLAISTLDLHCRVFQFPSPSNVDGEIPQETIELQELPARPNNVTGLIGIERATVVRRNPYLLGGNLVGRSHDLEKLREWLADRSEAKRIRCICDFGGAGKTALVWTWLTDKETQTQRAEMGYREFWTSFYARDYGWRNLIRDLAHAIGKSAPKDHEKDEVWSFVITEIIEHLNGEKWLLVLDGLEREMDAYAAEANFGADSEEQDSRKEAGLICESERSIRYPILADFIRRLTETRAKVLITSRIFPRNLDGVAEEYLLAKAVLTEEMAGALWKQQTQIGGTTEFFTRFYRLVDFHPQTIAIVASAVEAASHTIQTFDDWFNDAPPEVKDLKEACLDESSSTTSRRHRWLELATSDLPTKRPKEWILLCRVTGRSNPSNRASMVNALVRSGSPALFENEQKLLACIESLQRRRLIGYDPNLGEIDVHPVIRTVVYRHVVAIKDSKDEAARALWKEMKTHLDDQELRLKELSALQVDERARRVDEAAGLDSKARLDLFREFYLHSGANPWIAGLPALLLRRDQASVDLRTAMALSEIGETRAAEGVIARAKILFELNNDDQGLRECVASENWIWLYGGSLFDFEKRYLDLIESGDRNESNIYWLAICLAIRHHPSAALVLKKIEKCNTRWELQTVAEAFYYLDDYARAVALAGEAQNKREEDVQVGQELWEWVTLGLAMLRRNAFDEGWRFLQGAYTGSKSVHYRIVRLFALAGLIDWSGIQATRFRREIEIRPRIDAAIRFLREYDQLDEFRRYPIPASEALLAKARLMLLTEQSSEAFAAASESLRYAYGQHFGFSYAGGVKRAEEFLRSHFPNSEYPKAPKDSRIIREHELRASRFIEKFLNQ
jgi:thioredoxin reductase